MRQFLKIAEEMNVQSDVPIGCRNTTFVVHGKGCCLMMTPDHVVLSFGEQDTVDETLPQIELRFDEGRKAWELSLQPVDVDLPKELLLFAKQFKLTKPNKPIRVNEDGLAPIIRRLLERVTTSGSTFVRPPIASRVPIADHLDHMRRKREPVIPPAARIPAEALKKSRST
ncbi:MAG: hypothetical protein WCK01_04615 [Candidatus Uhrbacteria bacterium]